MFEASLFDWTASASLLPFFLEGLRMRLDVDMQRNILFDLSVYYPPLKFESIINNRLFEIYFKIIFQEFQNQILIKVNESSFICVTKKCRCLGIEVVLNNRTIIDKRFFFFL